MAGPSPGQALPATLKHDIVAMALEHGFDAVGFAPAALSTDARAGLEGYLRAGFHGDMGWLGARAESRSAPRTLWPEANSVIVLGANYAPMGDPLAGLDQPHHGNLSVYARGADYHDVLKGAVKRLARALIQRHGGDVKVFVDTAPVMEKPLAQAAGLGWQGKHTNLVSREFGSWLFLAELFTTLDLPPDTPHDDHCGTCRNCLDACPTKAFPAPHQLDARRCISYLTIEHKGHIAPEFRAAMGNRIYGCDDCLAVCPWNKFAKASREARFAAHPGREAPTLAALAGLDDPGFCQLFAGSPIKRIGRDRFVRNVLIAIGNTRDPALKDIAVQRLDDTSPLVRAMAVWALARLVEPGDFTALREARIEAEPDIDVRREWTSPFRVTGL